MTDFALEVNTAGIYDYLTYYVGTHTSGTEIATYWDSSPGNTVTCDPVITIFFHTDDSVTERGFQLNYLFGKCLMLRSMD